MRVWGFTPSRATLMQYQLLQIKRIGAIQEALAKQLLDKKTYEGLPPLVLSGDD